MGMGKSVTIGYKYFMGLQFAVCYGPVDALRRIIVGDRDAWSGTVSASTQTTIDNPELFGGEKKEGGIQGDLYVCMGESSQLPNTYLQAQLGASIPAFRGLLTVVYNGLVSAMNPYIKNWAFDIARYTQGWDGGVWYSSKVQIGEDMNPAHIVYQCLTDREWGMGYPSTAIDGASLTAAADTLYSEGFGLSFFWSQQDTIKSFASMIMRHIGGVLQVNRSTGLFQLKLIRSDYTLGTLPVVNQSNARLESWQRAAWGETANEVTVVYTDQLTGEDRVITVQDLANIETQGQVINRRNNYPGITSATLAAKVAMRDLRQASTPLAKAKFKVHRSAWSWLPGDVVRLTWEPLGIDGAYRILAVNWGSADDNWIVIDAAEDIFGLVNTTYTSQQPVAWSDPVSAPAAAPVRLVTETPYYDLARKLTAAELAYLDATDCRLDVYASRPSGDAFNFELWTRIGAAAYQNLGVGDFTTVATLTAAVGVEETSTLACSSLSALTTAPPTIGGYVLSSRGEYMRLDSYNTSTGAVTVARGALDTVPVAHSIGDVIWFPRDTAATDGVDYLQGDVVSVKCQTRTGRGTLALASTPADSYTAARRQNRPYPPGLFRINGQYQPSSHQGGAIPITWAERNRLTQTASIIGQGDATISPEAGTTYTATLTRTDNNAVLASVTGLTGTSATLTPTAYNGQVKLTLKAVRSALDSWTSQSCTFNWIIDLAYIGASSSITFSTVTSQAVTVPATTAAGDLLLAVVMHRSAMTSVPSGWTLVDTCSFQDSTALVQYLSIYSKTAVSGDVGASTTWTQTSSSRMAVQIHAVKKSGGGTPAIIGTPSKSTISTTGTGTYTLPTVAATVANQLAFTAASTVLAGTSSPNTLALSSQWTQASPSSSTDTSNQLRLAVGSAVLSSIGASSAGTATANVTGSTNGWGAITLLIG